MPSVHDFVRIKATGEKGRFMAIYPATDGTTLLIKTPAGDRHVDIAAGPYKVGDYLEVLAETTLAPRGSV